MRRARGLCASSLLALVTACGTTVPTAGSVPGGDLGLGPTSPADVPADQAGGPGAITGPGASAVPPGTGTSSPPVGQPQPGQPGAPVTARLGPGVDTKTITIGLTVQDNNATVSSLASTYNVQLADNRGAYEALVRHINANGGVAGRQLRPVYYTYDPTSGNADQIGQAACAALTEDAKVFAAVDALTATSFTSCMQGRGRVMLPYGLLFGGSRATWRKYPNVVAADGIPLESAGELLATHLASTGFLTRSTRLGAIVRSSADLTDAYRRGFAPALAKLGLSVAQTHYIRDAQAAAEISGYTADISSAVLKFQSSRIDRVVFFDAGSYAALVFSQTAEKQQYRPRYGFSSLNTIVALQGENSAAPQEQMVGAQGVSWETNADGLTKTKTRSAQQCLAILRAASIVPTDAATEGSYLKTCQTFFLFKAAADLAGHDLNRDTFLSAVGRLSSSFRGTNTWDGRTRFGPGDHSGVAVYRPFVYREQCSCFTVSGPAQAVAAS